MMPEILNENELLMTLRVVSSVFFGFLIGVERRGGKWGAGPRTFTLICMGSALFTVLSVYAFPDNKEPARLSAQIITGIGFIGAGVIWRSRTETLHGLTTAAAIWCSAAVGISVGLGHYILAFISTLATMVVLSKGHPVKEAKENLCLKEPEPPSHLENL